MQNKPPRSPSPKNAHPLPTPMEAQQMRHAGTRDTLHALAKDLHNVAAHSQALQDQSWRTIDASRATRAHPANRLQDPRLTVPEACRLVGVCERTLRVALREPALAARLEQGTRKVGTFYKDVLLLPPDLMDDLQLHFPAKKNAAADTP